MFIDTLSTTSQVQSRFIIYEEADISISLQLTPKHVDLVPRSVIWQRNSKGFWLKALVIQYKVRFSTLLKKCACNCKLYPCCAGDTLRLVNFRRHKLTHFLPYHTSPLVCACSWQTGWVTCITCFTINSPSTATQEICQSSPRRGAASQLQVLPRHPWCHSLPAVCSHRDHSRWWSWIFCLRI